MLPNEHLAYILADRWPPGDSDINSWLQTSALAVIGIRRGKKETTQRTQKMHKELDWSYSQSLRAFDFNSRTCAGPGTNLTCLLPLSHLFSMKLWRCWGMTLDCLNLPNGPLCTWNTVLVVFHVAGPCLVLNLTAHHGPPFSAHQLSALLLLEALCSVPCYPL